MCFQLTASKYFLSNMKVMTCHSLLKAFLPYKAAVTAFKHPSGATEEKWVYIFTRFKWQVKRKKMLELLSSQQFINWKFKSLILIIVKSDAESIHKSLIYQYIM